MPVGGGHHALQARPGGSGRDPAELDARSSNDGAWLGEDQLGRGVPSHGACKICKLQGIKFLGPLVLHSCETSNEIKTKNWRTREKQREAKTARKREKPGALQVTAGKGCSRPKQDRVPNHPGSPRPHSGWRRCALRARAKPQRRLPGWGCGQGFCSTQSGPCPRAALPSHPSNLDAQAAAEPSPELQNAPPRWERGRWSLTNIPTAGWCE